MFPRIEVRAHRELLANGDGPKVAERAKRRRMNITDYQPPPPTT
jgi:hypothetical protein